MRYFNRPLIRPPAVRLLLGAASALLLPVLVQAQTASRFEVFDRYDPTAFGYDVRGVKGEHIDPRTLGVSWEVEDFVLPGDGGLDIVISRSFNRLAHTPSQMGHWYFGVPRVQIPTSPWRGPFDPALPAYETFNAAWNNLYFRLNNGRDSICDRAGRLVDASVRGSLNNSNKGGILFAAPISLYIPGEGSKVLLDKLSSAGEFPADADYVTTDNWYASCLDPAPERSWGGMRVVSPRGVTYLFNFIQYLVPGDYGLASTGGWIELGISSVEDADGNRIDYQYDLAPGGTALLQSITASDGRVVEFEYHPGSRLGVDVQGSPLALVTAINIRVNGQNYPIRYSYCDFTDYYLLNAGCTPVTLGSGRDLPVLHEVSYPNGLKTRYRYVADIYSANVLFDWGGFNFLLDSVTLPTGGTVRYEYDPDYSAVLQNSDSPAPRLARRVTSGRDIEEGEWRYEYRYADHLETTTIRGPSRTEERQFYEGLGTYEFRIARYPGQHQWPGTAPTDYDEVMGRLRRMSIRDNATGTEQLVKRYQYALPNVIGSSHYSGNWLGWPTLTLAQRRRILSSRVTTTDMTGPEPLDYSVHTPASNFDAYGFPEVQHERGHNGGLADSFIYRRRQLGWHHDPAGWFIGQPASIRVGGAGLEYEYYAGNGRLKLSREFGKVTRYEYDSAGNLSALRWQRDGLDFFTELSDYRRGIAQRERRLVDPLSGSVETIRRNVDGFGHIRWEDDADGQRSRYRYDPMGRLLRSEPPATAAIDFTYTVTGAGFWRGIEIVQGTRRRRIGLDGFGRTTLLRDYADSRPAEPPLARSWRFGPAGRLKFASSPYEWEGGGTSPAGTAYAYDALDRLTTRTATADGSLERYCYSAACNTGAYSQRFGSRLVRGQLTTDADGFQTLVAYSAFEFPTGGEPTRVVRQLTGGAGLSGATFSETDIERDTVQKILAVTQSGPDTPAVRREFTYNWRQLMTREHHPESGATLHSYDNRGNRIQSTFADGAVYRWSYDGLDRLVAVDYPADVNDVALSYNAAGQLSRVSNLLTDWRYRYDPAGRLQQEVLRTQGELLEFNYTYDSLGHLQSVEYPSGREFAVDTDEHGRARAVEDAVDSAAYWPDGMPRRMVFANGVATSITQNARQREAQRRVTDDSGGVIADLSYSYDLRGNPLSIVDRRFPSQTRALAYDGASRLVAADGYWGAGQISYDAVGNIRSRVLGDTELRYEYGADNTPDAVVVDEARRFAIRHDSRGRVISDGLYDFEYGADAQITGIAQLPELSFGYDGHGQRTVVEDAAGQRIDAYDRSGKLAYTDACSAEGTTSEFVYLGEQLVARMDEPCAVSCHP